MVVQYRSKRLITFILLFSLVFSLFPQALMNQVEANTPDGKGDMTRFANFILDNTTKNSLGAWNSSNLPNSIDQSTKNAGFYSFASSQLPIGGSTIGVSLTQPIFVKVEQLIESGGNWVVVNQVSNTPLIRDSSDQRKFSSTINLRDGMNKLTFTGTNSNGLGIVSEVMYVRYDSTIFLNSITMMDGNDTINLDDSTPAVAKTQAVTFEIKASNATRVILNGREYLPLGNEFYVGPYMLKDGLNSITFKIVNSEGTEQEYTREVYYYNPNLLFVTGELKLNSIGPKSVYITEPQASFPVTTSSNINNGSEFNGQVLVPYLYGGVASESAQATRIKDSISGVQYSGVTVADQTVGGIHVDPTPVKLLRGPTGLNYALYNVTINSWNSSQTFSNFANPANVTINLGYISGSTSTASFTFDVVDNSKTYIDKIYYKSGSSELLLSTMTPTEVKPSNNEVEFILETSGTSLAGKDIEVSTPYGTGKENGNTGAYTVTRIAQVGNKVTFGVANLPNGEYNVTFSIAGETAGAKAGRIRIDNTPAVVFRNFSNGVTIDAKDLTALNSNDPYTQKVVIELPKIRNNMNVGKTSLFVNGSVAFNIQDTLSVPALETDLTLLPDPNTNRIVNFGGLGTKIGTIKDEPVNDKTIITVNEAALRRGENTLEFNLYVGGSLITKRSITFFIDDTRVPDLKEFKPVLPPQRGIRPDITNSTSLTDSQGISYNKLTGDHTTHAKEFDVVIQSNEMKRIEVRMDGDLLLEVDAVYNGTVFRNDQSSVTLYNQYQRNSQNDRDTRSFASQGNTSSMVLPLYPGQNKDIKVSYYSERNASTNQQNRFTFRIEGIQFFDKDMKDLETVRHFSLTIVSKNGSMVTVPMSVTRESQPYLIHSPIATVGDQIIVNKDYVPIYIEAEGATEVIIGKEQAVQSKEAGKEWWFTYTYTGLKADKWNPIKFTIVRGTEKVNGQIDVYYGTTNQEGASNMLPLSSKMNALNKTVSLSFPKNILLRQREVQSDRQKLYQGHYILFGNADDKNGLVDRLQYNGESISPNSNLRGRFANLPDTFVPVSQIVFIHGGLGDRGNPTDTNYEPSIKYGIQPHEDPYVFTNLSINNRVLEPSERGELTLKYDSSIRTSANPTVTVFRLNQDGRWENIGGVVKKDEITVPFDDFGYYVAMRWRDNFEDMSNHAWGSNVMQIMYAKGLMNGKQKSIEFGATDPVTRGEFAQLMVKALGLPLNYQGRETFLDVRDGYTGRNGSMPHEGPLWEYKYIETAARAGVISGVSSGLFLPNNRLTREQAAAMLANALNLKLAKNDKKLERDLLKQFQDGTSVSYYFRPAVMAVNKAKIIGGIPNPKAQGDKKETYNFNPRANLTRAEAASMIVRVMQNQLKKLPKAIDTTNPQAQF